jgi:hypothetical protein
MTLSERLHFFMNQTVRSQRRLDFVYQTPLPRRTAPSPRTWGEGWDEGA